jgi:hypothetical protein
LCTSPMTIWVCWGDASRSLNLRLRKKSDVRGRISPHLAGL